MQSQPTYQLGSREKPQYYVRNQEDYGRNQHHEVADNYIYQGIKISCVWCLLKSPRQTTQTKIRLLLKKQSNFYLRGQKYFKSTQCPEGRVTYNFHSSCKHMHLSFKSVCNKEHKGVICNMTSSSNSSQSTHPTGRVLGKNYSSFLDFTRNYERTSGIYVPWVFPVCYSDTYSVNSSPDNQHLRTEREKCLKF